MKLSKTKEMKMWKKLGCESRIDYVSIDEANEIVILIVTEIERLSALIDDEVEIENEIECVIGMNDEVNVIEIVIEIGISHLIVFSIENRTMKRRDLELVQFLDCRDSPLLMIDGNPDHEFDFDGDLDRNHDHRVEGQHVLRWCGCFGNEKLTWRTKRERRKALRDRKKKKKRTVEKQRNDKLHSTVIERLDRMDD